eukprot:CAMPEP_0181498360 /NCGR_PEP_ID=MMETSP1110-20121109/54060_1 /TAXON_ID=174948 /ORGANISM="Symbiodinium sp., Strain CCMP421" /LENGTH=98 /DNA_ID=CAMNT_0023626427 /DNA_START=323 /DNA_END=615 /DNA_ORIENTATION=-
MVSPDGKAAAVCAVLLGDDGAEESANLRGHWALSLEAHLQRTVQHLAVAQRKQHLAQRLEPVQGPSYEEGDADALPAEGQRAWVHQHLQVSQGYALGP